MKKGLRRIMTGIMILLLLASTACRANDTQEITSFPEDTEASVESASEFVSADDNDANRWESHAVETSTDAFDQNDKVEEETTETETETEESTDSAETKVPEKEETKSPAETKAPETEETKDPAETEQPEVNEADLLPWEKPGAKQPSEYTAQEFETLTSIQKQAFVASFDSVDDFNAWMERVTGDGSAAETGKMPWEKSGAKQPEEYTWDEYEALTTVQKEAFFDTFDSADDFNNWLNRVTGKGDSAEVEQMPWEKPGAKQPEEYTWGEYEALTATQKEAFFDSFDSVEDFNNWMNRVTGKEDSADSSEAEKLPWENGGKQPEEYTWDEYEALTPAQKEAFFDSFDSADDFDQWMNRVTGREDSTDSTEIERMPWENGGKQPEEYTWDEYEALTPVQKEAFFDSFDSTDEFDDWMKRAKGQNDTTGEDSLPWENGGKQPAEYTWDEYEALTPAQKEAFFDSFEDIEAFDAWLKANQP